MSMMIGRSLTSRLQACRHTKINTVFLGIAHYHGAGADKAAWGDPDAIPDHTAGSQY